jgi:hypothetical protein
MDIFQQDHRANSSVTRGADIIFQEYPQEKAGFLNREWGKFILQPFLKNKSAYSIQGFLFFRNDTVSDGGKEGVRVAA